MVFPRGILCTRSVWLSDRNIGLPISLSMTYSKRKPEVYEVCSVLVCLCVYINHVKCLLLVFGSVTDFVNSMSNTTRQRGRWNVHYVVRCTWCLRVMYLGYEWRRRYDQVVRLLNAGRPYTVIDRNLSDSVDYKQKKPKKGFGFN